MKFHHFWPKNDGEKWSRKNIFEIPPCTHHFLLNEKEDFDQKNKFSNKNDTVSG